MATQKEETLPQYKVVADGKLVGYKSWNFGSKIVFIEKLSPEEIAQVKSDVEYILGDTAGHVNAPDEEGIISKYDEESSEEEVADDFN